MHIQKNYPIISATMKPSWWICLCPSSHNSALFLAIASHDVVSTVVFLVSFINRVSCFWTIWSFDGVNKLITGWAWGCFVPILSRMHWIAVLFLRGSAKIGQLSFFKEREDLDLGFSSIYFLIGKGARMEFPKIPLLYCTIRNLMEIIRWCRHKDTWLEPKYKFRD